MFGAMMVDDHSTAETSLDSLASALKIAIPSEPDEAHKAQPLPFFKQNLPVEIIQRLNICKRSFYQMALDVQGQLK